MSHSPIHHPSTTFHQLRFDTTITPLATIATNTLKHSNFLKKSSSYGFPLERRYIPRRLFSCYDEQQKQHYYYPINNLLARSE